MNDTKYDDWFNAQLDKHGAWEWVTNDIGEQVDIILTNHHLNDDVQINRIVDFFTSIDAPMLKKGSITKLYEDNQYDIADIIKLTERQFINVLGENGKKAYAGLRKALTEIPMYKLIGAYSSERGIGVRKIKKLQQAFGRDGLYSLQSYDKDDIAAVDGFDEKTATRVVNALAQFHTFVVDIDGYVSFAEDETSANGALVGQKVCFTGFRDKALQAEVESAGGEMQSAVSGKTSLVVTTDPNGTSGKLKKARDLGIQIISIDDLRRMI